MAVLGALGPELTEDLLEEVEAVGTAGSVRRVRPLVSVETGLGGILLPPLAGRAARPAVVVMRSLACCEASCVCVKVGVDCTVW